MHTVIDNFAPLGLVRALAATWLPDDSGHWYLYDNGKRVTKDPLRLPSAAASLIRLISEVPVDQILGTEGAFPDLEYLHGAGMHYIMPGGSLNLHADSERHPSLPWRRVASAILYVDDVDGGELEMCDSQGVVTDRIQIVENRLVLFTTQGQWHRVARCDSVRRSVCLFFWDLKEGGVTTTATFARSDDETTR